MNIKESSGRLYYVDWLRVLAMGGIFFFHNARFYDVWSDWHVKNATTNVGASVLIAFMSQWIMPLFFLIAGGATFSALKSRNAGQYSWERTLRILVPLIFGMLILVVPQAYFQAVFRGELPPGLNIFQVYWLYLKSVPELNWFHLWYLSDLFLFSLIVLPLFIGWKKGGKSVITKLSGLVSQPWLFLPLMVISLTIVNTLIYPEGSWGYGNGGFSIVPYVLFFIFGYLIFANMNIVELLKKYRWSMLGGAVVAGVFLYVFFIDELADPTVHFGTAKFALAMFTQAMNSCLWLLAFVGLAGRYLTFNNRFLAYSNEAVLPFYLLHQTVIIVIGFHVVQWNTGVAVKYPVIAISSFIGIMAIYELLVRRFNALRFLFGMRAKKALPKPQITAGTG